MNIDKTQLSLALIQYLWDNGVYTEEDMKYLVDNFVISKQEFFQITRKVYKNKE